MLFGHKNSSSIKQTAYRNICTLSIIKIYILKPCMQIFHRFETTHATATVMIDISDSFKFLHHDLLSPLFYLQSHIYSSYRYNSY